ncbi:MAG: nucleotidyl transferase AbiEii/AbiGii toxin family protein [Acidobacteriota bacterium]|nr:nucleotidyl transferase AbiEii/AbiGii toxin family protein [Acidobacteriota bacterium]
MTDRLVEDPDGVNALAARVAEVTGIPASHVEKDFWVTEVLRGVAQQATRESVTAIFKGGTSLSKAYKLIRRFSEDVDMLVVLPARGIDARNSILKRLVDGASAATGLEAVTVNEACRKGEKRGARFHYRGQPAGAGLSDGVFLELGSMGGAMPTDIAELRSLLAEHAGEQISGFPEAEPVEVRVLRPARTLVEKLVLLHTAHSAESPEAARRAARHYYDVHQLLAASDVLADVAASGVDVMARDVCTYSIAAEQAASPRPVDGFAASPAFNNGPHVPIARAEYEQRVSGQLLWPGAPHPSFDDCVAAVHAAARHL